MSIVRAESLSLANVAWAFRNASPAVAMLASTSAL